eukprot:scaffold665661_cov47-Prasinocladus_malaysianus.AAC.1
MGIATISGHGVVEDASETVVWRQTHQPSAKIGSTRTASTALTCRRALSLQAAIVAVTQPSTATASVV